MGGIAGSSKWLGSCDMEGAEVGGACPNVWLKHILLCLIFYPVHDLFFFGEGSTVNK